MNFSIRLQAGYGLGGIDQVNDCPPAGVGMNITALKYNKDMSGLSKIAIEITIAARLLATAAAALLLLAGCGEDPSAFLEERATERSLPIRAVEIAPRTLDRTIQLSGVVEPRQQVRLAARTDGVITRMLVEEGDRVEQGQLLAEIDVREARAELRRSEANLNQAETAFKRMQQLLERSYIDDASFEAARAELEIARAEMELWQTRVSFGEVRSSLDGVVVERYFEPGEAISRLEPLVTLAAIGQQVLRLGVSELDVGGVSVGDQVRLTIDALLGSGQITGRVQRIFPAADSASRLVTVEIALPDAQDHGIRPGYLARAELVVERIENALVVPVTATGRTSGGEHFVMVINDDGRIERRVIEPGVTRGTWRVVEQGLSAGERIVATNPLDLNEGEKVRIVDWVS